MASRFTRSEPSQRQLRVGELVRHGLSDILRKGDVLDPVLDRAVITVTEVSMSPDLKIATAFVAPMATSNPDEIIDALNRHAKFLRGQLSPVLRQMKFMPQLRFRQDSSFENFEKIDRILRSPDVRRDLEQTDRGSEEDEPKTTEAGALSRDDGDHGA